MCYHINMLIVATVFHLRRIGQVKIGFAYSSLLCDIPWRMYCQITWSITGYCVNQA
jgi:hypothetical protein